VTSFDSLAAVLPTRDVNAALGRYQRLGFDVSPFRDGSEYGYARRGNVNLHLAHVDDLDPSTSLVATYLYVGNADDVHAEWNDAGVEGRLVAPVDTDYGLREGAYVDPDGNLLRYGSRIPEIDGDSASTS
jgi:hypothetical protein